MLRSSSDLNASRNVAITTHLTVRPSLWTRFVDSFKPPEGSDALNDVDPSCSPQTHPWDGFEKKGGEEMARGEAKGEEGGEADEGLGRGAGVVDGDGSRWTDRFDRD